MVRIAESRGTVEDASEGGEGNVPSILTMVARGYGEESSRGKKGKNHKRLRKKELRVGDSAVEPSPPSRRRMRGDSIRQLIHNLLPMLLAFSK